MTVHIPAGSLNPKQFRRRGSAGRLQHQQLRRQSEQSSD